MSQSVGDIHYTVDAKTDGLLRAGRDVDRSTARMGKSFDAARFKLNKLASAVKVGSAAIAAGAVVVAGAAAGLFAYARAGMAVIDAEAKLADKLDATIGEWRGIKLAASDAGIEHKRLEGSMKSYTKRLGDATRGTGQAQKAYEALGLEASELARMPLPEQLAKVSERIQQLDTVAERSSIADSLMSGGRDVVALFEAGGDAIRDAVQEIEDYGLAISRVDAAMIEAANDAFSRTGMTLQSVQETLAVEMAPILLVITDRFNDAAREAGGMGSMVEGAVSSALTAIGNLLDIYYEWELANQRIILGTADMNMAMAASAKSMWESIGGFLDRWIRGLNKVISGMNNIPGFDIEMIGSFSSSDFMGGINDQYAEAMGARNLAAMDMNDLEARGSLSKGFDEFLDDVADRRKKMEADAAHEAGKEFFKPLDGWLLNDPESEGSGSGGGGGGGSSGRRGGDTGAAARESAQATREAAREIMRQRDAYIRLRDTLYPIQASQKKFAEEKALIDQHLVEGTDEHTDAVRRLRGEYESTQTVAEAYGEGASESLSKVSDAAEDVGMTFSSAMEDAISKGKSFQDVLAGIAEDLARLATRELVTKPLAGAITSGISGMFGGNAIEGGFTSQIDLPGYASGGYTGNGGRNEIAGVVHGGEVVIPKSVVDQPGMRGYLEQLASAKGYLSGGYVGSSSGGSSRGIGGTTINIHNNAGAEVQQQESSGSDGSRQIDVYIERKVKSMHSNGSMDSTMSRNYGIRRRPV